MMRQERADRDKVDPFFQYDRQRMADRAGAPVIAIGLAGAPATAMGNFFQATAQAMGNAAHNATNAYQQAQVTALAGVTAGVATLLAVDTRGALDPDSSL